MNLYTKFYGLKEEPFLLTPDPRFLHLAQPHREALTSLLESMLLRRGIMVFTGPVGTGKTTLLHAALQVLSEKPGMQDRLRSAFVVIPTLSSDEFLEAVLDEFEIPSAGKSKPARLQALHRMLLETYRMDGLAVLLIDEAHLLTSELLEEVRLLSNVDTYGGKLLQIVLCGQPELLPALRRKEMTALQQRIASRSSLRPLSQVEARGYIVERLNIAGLRDQSSFTPRSLEAIYFLSRGVPRVINLLCDGCLRLGARTQQKQIQPEMVEEVAESMELNSEEPSTDGLMIPAPADQAEVLQTAVDVLIHAMKQARRGGRE
jgi:general secretion pathway protein A